jgi:hypothetical protein
MDKAQMGELWAQAVTNNQKLNSCGRHRFTDPLPPVEQRFQAKLTCCVCGGAMRLTDMYQYIRGYEASGKDGGDIWPYWRLDIPGESR